MISVIVPVFNEELSIEPLCQSLTSVLDRLSRAFEIILVNDGSTDGSRAALLRAAGADNRIKVVNLRRNFGQTAAMMAGIEHASGEVLVPIDGDLQNDPEDIPLLLEKLDEGYDVVSGWRMNRQDDSLRRNLPSRIANALISRVSGVRLHDYGCTLKVYRREVIKDVKLYGEMHRFVPIYASWLGARVSEVAVRHHARRFGKSNYGLGRVFKVLLDLVVVQFLARYSTKPIYVFGAFGALFLLIGLLAGAYAIYLKCIFGTSFIQTPLPLLTVMGLMTGMTSVLMGLLAELIMRTYYESQQKRTYLVRDTINLH